MVEVVPLHKIWFLISTKKNFLIWYFSMDDFSWESEGTLHPKHLKILDGPSPPFPTLRICMYKDSFKTSKKTFVISFWWSFASDKNPYCFKLNDCWFVLKTFILEPWNWSWLILVPLPCTKLNLTRILMVSWHSPIKGVKLVYSTRHMDCLSFL